MARVVLIRHGESVWNKENRFTGWTDVDLTEKGRKEAEAAGELLLREGYEFDIAYTSVLKRAIRTLWMILDKMDRMWIPVENSWRLNERHYGALQGLNKLETVEKHGSEQVQIWRRSYATPPPVLGEEDPRHPSHDSRYRNLLKEELPSTESLKDTVARFVPYWEETIWPQVKKGKSVLIAAHGNSLRALLKHVEGISEDDIVELNIPTGIPMVLEFDDHDRFLKRSFLGDAEAAARAAEAVARQTSAKNS